MPAPATSAERPQPPAQPAGVPRPAPGTAPATPSPAPSRAPATRSGYRACRPACSPRCDADRERQQTSSACSGRSRPRTAIPPATSTTPASRSGPVATPVTASSTNTGAAARDRVDRPRRRRGVGGRQQHDVDQLEQGRRDDQRGDTAARPSCQTATANGAPPRPRPASATPRRPAGDRGRPPSMHVPERHAPAPPPAPGPAPRCSRQPEHAAALRSISSPRDAGSTPRRPASNAACAARWPASCGGRAAAPGAR